MASTSQPLPTARSASSSTELLQSENFVWVCVSAFSQTPAPAHGTRRENPAACCNRPAYAARAAVTSPAPATAAATFRVDTRVDCNGPQLGLLAGPPSCSARRLRYFDARRRNRRATTTRPEPSSSRLPGSGTADGSASLLG